MRVTANNAVYAALRDCGLRLDLTRGKPSPQQLDLPAFTWDDDYRARMPATAGDFRLFWDNAYAAHLTPVGGLVTCVRLAARMQLPRLSTRPNQADRQQVRVGYVADG